MAEQPVNLSTVLYLGVFSRAEQRVLQAIFKAIADGGGRCVATLAMLARESNTSKATTRNAIARAVAIGLLEKTERRSYYAVSRPNILTYGEAFTAPHLKATHDLRLLEVAYSDGDRGRDDARSEVDLTLSNASLRPLAGLPELC